jgi:hypothetical protein
MIRALFVLALSLATAGAASLAFGAFVGSPRTLNPSPSEHRAGIGPADFISNDMFANAAQLAPAVGDFFWNKGSTLGYSGEPGEPHHGGSDIQGSAWFYWTAPADGVFTVDTFGSIVNTSLFVYTGSSVDALSLVAWNNDYQQFYGSLVQFRATAGTTYSIALDSGAQGNYYLDWEFQPDGETSVWRFYNTSNGSHFYTASPVESTLVYNWLYETYDLDGLAYRINSANPVNGSTLFRFYNKRNGGHFYTADVGEKNNVETNLAATYSYDGPAYYVCPTPVAGSTKVWRFYNKLNGSHFYTADPAEKNRVQTNMTSTYQLDGPAFYLAP